jgi:hypothetical protein
MGRGAGVGAIVTVSGLCHARPSAAIRASSSFGSRARVALTRHRSAPALGESEPIASDVIGKPRGSTKSRACSSSTGPVVRTESITT